jgi:hypothetical protein
VYIQFANKMGKQKLAPQHGDIWINGGIVPYIMKIGTGTGMRRESG